MSFELLYREIGDIGRYQKYVLLLGWTTGLYGGFIFINSVFLLYAPAHRCAIPGYANDTFEIQSEAHQRLINQSIPHNSDGKYEKCLIYATTNNGSEITHATTQRCHSWVYDRSLFSSTLGMKFDLVCDRAILKATAQMIFFAGLLLGSFVSGLISDRFGRRPTICTSLTLITGVALSIAWTPSIEVYMFQSACVGFISVGFFMPIFVLGNELVGPSKRLYSGQIYSLFWPFGYLIIAGFAYLIRDWSTFQLVCATPGVVFLSFWVLYPESPRWLYFQGRHEELKKFLRKTASINKVKMSEDFFENLPIPKKEEGNVGFHKLFSHRTLAIRTCVLYVNWIAVCMATYGLALNSDGIGSGSGIHLYFALQCVMDVPAAIIVLVLADKTGRKRLMIVTMLIGGLACIGTIFTTLYGGNAAYTSTLILALVGKIGASTGFHLIYQYSAELFPTVVRNSGIGSCSCMARIGGIVAPLVADLDRLVGGNIGKGLPLLVFGVFCVIAGLLIFLLPETVGKELPGTIEDGIAFGRESNSKRNDEDYAMRSLVNSKENNKINYRDSSERNGIV